MEKRAVVNTPKEKLAHAKAATQAEAALKEKHRAEKEAEGRDAQQAQPAPSRH